MLKINKRRALLSIEHEQNVKIYVIKNQSNFKISVDPGKKCSTGQRFIRKEVTSYKIHILEKSEHIHSRIYTYEQMNSQS